MTRILKSSTALLLVFSLSLPAPVIAADEATSGLVQGQKPKTDPEGASATSVPAVDAQQPATDQTDADAKKAERKAKRKAEREAQATETQATETQAATGQTAPATQATDQQTGQQTGQTTTQPAGQQTTKPKGQQSGQQTGQQSTQQTTQPTSQQSGQQTGQQTQTVKQSPQTDPKAAAEQAKRDERRAKRKADRAAEREKAKAAGNVLPPDTQAQADLAADEARRNAAVAAAAGAGAAQVATATVGQGDVRSSSQEYAPRPSAEGPSAGKPGMSDVGKVVLLGLGALAIGQLLSNGDKVVANSGDRVVVEGDDGYRVLKDDDVLLRQPGSQVRTETYSDGSSRSFVARPDGSQVVTIRAADGRVLRRASILPDGREVVLFDDTQVAPPVEVAFLPAPDPRAIGYDGRVSSDDLTRAMLATGANPYGRRFSLSQIRSIDAVRRLVPEIEIDNVRFASGSSVIRPDQAYQLAALGGAIRNAILANPAEVFLIEGHTDATGSAEMNLALSDRRAETVALALTEYFAVPPENLVVQGYGEADLKVWTPAAEEANRRVAVRRITPLLY